MSEEELAVTTVLEALDFEPVCSARTCQRVAAWSYECVYECGMGGLLCGPHHELLAGSVVTRRCGGCRNQAPFRSMVIFRSLGGAR